jgi:hypothetical protein
MNNKDVTIKIKTLVGVEGKYTYTQIIKMSGIVRSTFYNRIKFNSWTKTEKLALTHLGILKD